MTTTIAVLPRVCTCCSRGMIQGFVIDDGLMYFCSKICLKTQFTDAEYEELYDDGDGSSYWTQWEQDDADEDDEPVEHCAYLYGVYAFADGLARIPGLDYEFCMSLSRAPIPAELKPLEQWLEGFDYAKSEHEQNKKNEEIRARELLAKAHS